jgi:acetyltransferase-like isoleucine patch superfamily enzyme
MKLAKIITRFFVPAPFVTLYYLKKYGCKVSPRAEVDLTPLIVIGKNTRISSFSKIKASEGKLQIGKETAIGTNCFIAAEYGGVTIGDYCFISPNVAIIGNNYKYNRLDIPVCQQEKISKGITIGDDVWLAAGVVVLDGASIGSHVIVSPNSVVSGKIPDNVIVQGNPAKVIFKRR